MVRARQGGGPKAALERSGRRGPTTPPGACQESSGSGADLETREPRHGGVGGVQDLLDRLLGLEDRLLVEQDDLLEERVDPTLDDPLDGSLGLALLEGL